MPEYEQENTHSNTNKRQMAEAVFSVDNIHQSIVQHKINEICIMFTLKVDKTRNNGYEYGSPVNLFGCWLYHYLWLWQYQNRLALKNL